MMDGWAGDLAQVAIYLCVIVLLVLLYVWLGALRASGKRHDDVAMWQQHLEHERTQLTARRMVREIEDEKELDRMWRQG